MPPEPSGLDDGGAARPGGGVGGDPLAAVEAALLGGAPTLTKLEVAERTGVPLELAEELWRLLGFPHRDPEDVAFTESDVEALGLTRDLVMLGVLGPDSQAALVRTWGRSYARLAEWQTGLLTGLIAARSSETESPETESPETEAPAEDLVLDERLLELIDSVVPRVERLQSYIWRRHLAGAAGRAVSTGSPGSTGDKSTTMAVCFVDIVGYTSQSKRLAESELVDWVESFEHRATQVVVDHGGRVIKTIGDEILLVADSPTVAAQIALDLVALGADEDDSFPRVRAGVAYGEVVSRLGDVYGPVVNIAARLTSLARPSTVLVDRSTHDELCHEHDIGDPKGRDDGSPYRFQRMRRRSVKGYSRLEPWVLRRR
ncbi:adenylate/guanylate cyclase domain-containing protein [Nocardioides pacificus]